MGKFSQQVPQAAPPVHVEILFLPRPTQALVEFLREFAKEETRTLRPFTALTDRV
jgi:hypothetical protein